MCSRGRVSRGVDGVVEHAKGWNKTAQARPVFGVGGLQPARHLRGLVVKERERVC